MQYWVWTLRMIGAIILLWACTYHYTNYSEEIHKLSFHLCKVIFTAALHFRTLFLCPCFLQLHGFYWQEGRKHTKPVLSGGLPWLTDLTTRSVGNNFWLSSVDWKQWKKKKNPASSYTGESSQLNSRNSYSKIHILEGDLQSRHSSNHLERCYSLEEQQTASEIQAWCTSWQTCHKHSVLTWPIPT